MHIKFGHKWYYIFVIALQCVIHNSLWQYFIVKVLYVLNATDEGVQEKKLILLSQASKTA